jgi:hypothetical protein
MAPQSKKDEFRQTFAHAMLEWKRVEGYLLEAAASSEAGTTGSPAATEARLPSW